MATDATGTPTSPDNIPTFNTAADKPSGNGFNAAMAAIQSIITQLKAGTLASGKIAIAALAGYPSDSTKYLAGDGTWGTPSTAPSGAAGGDLSGTYPNPTIGTGKVTSTHIADGTIVNGDISASAAIAASKLDLYPGSLLHFLRGDGTWPQMLVGRINSDGTIASGTGFTVTKLGSGDYRINFSSAFSATPVVLGIVSGFATYMRDSAPSTTSVELLTGDGSDHAFAFLAFPVS